MKQRTILRESSLQGKSLHTGKNVKLTLKPAPENTGIIFRRTDLLGKPELKPQINLVMDDLVRSTDISSGHTKVHTVEHVLSALAGSGVHNIIVEMDASEPPILDGSAKHFVNLIQKCEPVEQDAEVDYFALKEPISVTDGNRSVIALPYDGLKITCTSADDRGIHTQHLSLDIDIETYIASIAPARTFTIYEDIEPLLKMGKIQGGSLDSAIVIKGNQILSKEPLRFKDEFVRHKILDILGDIVLLGKPLKAHIVAVRTGHLLNSKLTREIYKQMTQPAKPPAPQPVAQPNQRRGRMITSEETILDIRRILDILPHTFPFLLIDRVIDFSEEESLVAIKNVSFNEPYFLGHFPGNPVMPGVLQLESMAQAAGVLMLKKVSSENKIAYFMSAEKVKFRRAVTPGDQLVITAKLVKNRGHKIAVAACECKVDGKIVSSGELMFTVVDAPEPGA